MKIGFMTFACPEWPLTRIITAAQQYHYHGVEFRMDAKHRHGVEVYAHKEERKEIRKRLDDAGIECCCLATSLQFVGEKVFTEAPQRIDLAAEIGAPALRVFCGPRPETMSMTEVVQRVGEHLRPIAELAAEADMELWLETHDTFSRAADAVAAVRLAAHPAIGINYDNMHPYRLGETLEQTVAALGDLVRHCHFHDALNSPDTVLIKPLGEGDMPIDAMFSALVKMGFTGYLSGEWFDTQYGAEPDESLRRYHEDITALAERHKVRLAE